MTVLEVIHNAYMPNDSALTVRIPASLKRQIEARAEASHRSVSAQVLHDLLTAAGADRPTAAPGSISRDVRRQPSAHRCGNRGRPPFDVAAAAPVGSARLTVADLVYRHPRLRVPLAAPNRLGRGARRALERVQAGEVAGWIPAAVVAEVLMLKERGRVSIGLPELHAATDAAPGLRFLALDWKQLDEFAALGAIKDPFDRLVVAACRAVSARLVTRDERLQDTGLVTTVWR